MTDNLPRPENLNIALLVNFIPPYRVPLFRKLNNRFQAFRIFVSTKMEGNRYWEVDWAELNVTQQRSFYIQQTHRFAKLFNMVAFIHLPYDTIPQLRRASPDIVMSGELGLRSLLASIYVLFSRKARLVLWLTLSEHTERHRGRFRRLVRRYLLNRADSIMVNGSSGRRYVEDFGVQRSRIVKIYQSVDSEMLSAVQYRPAVKPSRILIVGELEPRKGVIQFLKCLSTEADAGTIGRVSVDFVGHGSLSTEIEGLKLNALINVRLHGFVPYYDIAPYFENTTIMAFPTLADEWGLVVNEAMIAGVPVLGSVYSQAVEDMVVDGVHGWTFRPDSPDSMATAIRQALTAPSDDLAEMSARCRNRAALYSLDAMSRRMIRAVQIASRNHPAARQPS